MAAIEIRPQPGPQERFLSSPADIVIYGGGAGGGKTWSLLLEPLRHIRNKDFGAVIFRRTSPQIRNEGGLWDESTKLYPLLKAMPKESVLEWVFPSGARLKFSHLQHEKDKHDWQGSQIPFIGFDELCHFTESQFFYMLSRNRSMCGVRPYIRATCNPDADSWVARFIAWWIDQTTGLPIPERAGKLRYFVRVNDALIWADSPDELTPEKLCLPTVGPDGKPLDLMPKSVTFIPATIFDNKKLMEADPGYLANLMAMPTVERERLLGGNWKIRPAAGLYFRREWCEVVDAVPAGLKMVRYWDLAATEKTDDNDPDWTVGILMGRQPGTGIYYLCNAIRLRRGPGEVERTIKNTATTDGKGVVIGLPQDPGQAGKSQARYYVSQLAGYTVKTQQESGDKITRFSPFSAQCQAGNVKVVRGAWNEEVFTVLEGFPERAHDDDVDACSGAFDMLTEDDFVLPTITPVFGGRATAGRT